MVPTVFQSRDVSRLLLLTAIGSVYAVADPSQTKLPVVDLGYNLHRATSFDATGNFYNFSNIRYAAPPTGENRWRVPQPPEQDRSTVQTGLPDRICPNVFPDWFNNIALPFVDLYLNGQTEFNASSFNTTGSSTGNFPQDPRTTEDCLFLDVAVPKHIFHISGKHAGAPVLVWIHGGGYATGSKTYFGNPAGLLARSEEDDREGIIYVSLNYRLGAFGFLSGPTFQEDGTPNVGLYDQRLALQWVKQYIHLFGGDPSRVTVMGESAGGGSIMHQITAHGGRSPALFEQAIMQSPGFFPIVSNHEQERSFNEYLSLLGVETLDEARQLPFSDLQAANLKQIGSSQYGLYTYGPTIDGDFVPALSGELLLHGQFDKSVKVMVGHNTNEGLLFTSPFIQNDTAFKEQTSQLIPSVDAYADTLDYIVNTLYPPIFDGTQAEGYTNQIARAAAGISELVFSCNAFYIDKAFNNETYSYYFTVPPAIHGTDVQYTFYNGPSPMVLDDHAALTLQRYITNFVAKGDPNGDGVPEFPVYGDEAMVLELNITTRLGRDTVANERCNWWQKVLYA